MALHRLCSALQPTPLTHRGSLMPTVPVRRPAADLQNWRHTEWSLLVEQARQGMLVNGWSMMEALEAFACSRYGGVPDVVLEFMHQAIAPYHVGPQRLLDRLHWQRQLIADDGWMSRDDALQVMVDARDALMVEEPAP